MSSDRRTARLCRADQGAGKPTDKILAEIADECAFLVKSLDIKVPEGFGK